MNLTIDINYSQTHLSDTTHTNKETLKKIIKLRVYIKGTPKLMEGAPKGQSWKNWGKKKDLIQSIK